MDGVEWMRQKWGWPEKLWLRFNEHAGCWLGNHLVADHPCIASRLERIVARSKIAMIPYGADAVDPQPDTDLPTLQHFGLGPRSYALVIARPEPENSILEIVSAFSRTKRHCRLIVLGRFDAQRSRYHAAVISAASAEVTFVGAIYDQGVVACLRANARLYVHGHSVGGTNPSLVEAMGAGCAILARDNEFNRWVAGGGAVFFHNTEECDRALSAVLRDELKLTEMRLSSRLRHKQCFTWATILDAYERLLSNWVVLREWV
jgi:glycosyltransferase involved in cell wall biosynthesis